MFVLRPLRFRKLSQASEMQIDALIHGEVLTVRDYSDV